MNDLVSNSFKNYYSHEILGQKFSEIFKNLFIFQVSMLVFDEGRPKLLESLWLC
jgi:hypothetical protein